MRRIPLFGTGLLEGNGFHIVEKVEITRGITYALAGRKS